MLPLEIVMIISQVCLSPSSLDKDVQNSVNCNQIMNKTFTCCNFEQEVEYIFPIDNYEHEACYCGICDNMVVLGWCSEETFKGRNK